jgi:mono/diheme cytochrome c family protein
LTLCLIFTGICHASEVGSQELFVELCASCHGKDGKAKTLIGRKMRVEDLTQSKATDVEMEKQITEGTKDKRNNQRMPSFKEKLSPEGIESLIVFVKTLRK